MPLARGYRGSMSRNQEMTRSLHSPSVTNLNFRLPTLDGFFEFLALTLVSTSPAHRNLYPWPILPVIADYPNPFAHFLGPIIWVIEIALNNTSIIIGKTCQHMFSIISKIFCPTRTIGAHFVACTTARTISREQGSLWTDLMRWNYARRREHPSADCKSTLSGNHKEKGLTPYGSTL